MSHVIILSGVSGSGKSTYAKSLKADMIVSADNYFLDENGKYNFDLSKLGDAHADCFKKFVLSIYFHCHKLILVDNTNCTVDSISPYILASAAFNCDAEIITMLPPMPILPDPLLDILVARNSHNVPKKSIANQLRNLSYRKLPKYWKNTNIPIQF